MTAKEFIKSKQNGVLLNDYTLQEMEWFMTEFAKQKERNRKNRKWWGNWLTTFVSKCT
tara:strand:+ start:54 stop:227 length:174 start_codon:yes stop_codon:yes gene_type:complete